MQVKIGDILAGSWGYSMTLWCFCKVVKVTPKQVVLRELKHTTLGGHQGALHVEPIIDDFREGQIRCANKNPDYIWVKHLRCLLRPFDPTKQYIENHMD
jgi:hypothetical protein